MALPAVEMPALFGTREKKFQIGRRQQTTPSDGGFIQTIDRVTPTWWAEYVTPPLSPERLNAVQAFLDGLEGATNTFLGYDPYRPMPFAYKHLTTLDDPWTAPGFDAPRVVSGDYFNSRIFVDRLAAGAKISVGDYISVFVDPAWYLFRVRVDRTSSGPDKVMPINVQPRPVFSAIEQNMRYRRAPAEMKIIGGYQETTTVDTPTSFSFKAYQFIRRAA